MAIHPSLPGRTRALRRALVAAAVLVCFTGAGLVPATAEAATASWSTFRAHEISAFSRGEDYVADLQAAADAGDYYALLRTSRALYAYAKREVTWLNAHRPLACYKAWWGYARNFWTQLREAAADVTKGLERLDVAWFTRAWDHVDRAGVYASRFSTHYPTC